MKQLTVLILVIFCFNKGSALDECNRCDCCKNSETRCGTHKSTSDYCLNGCIAGYYGVRCTHACIDNCSTCSDPSSCTKCRDGYYGSNCSECPSVCLRCSSYNECQECKDGHYNGRYLDSDEYSLFSNCLLECKVTCKSCTSYYSCNTCKDGYYNGKQYFTSFYNFYDCRHPCYKNCRSCSSYYTCNECKIGFYNEPVWHNGIWFNNCTLKCNGACKSCTSATKCTECDARHYLINVDEHTVSCYKCKDNCLSCSSIEISTKCEPGWYGTTCEHECSSGCSHGHCDKGNGHCSCADGFTGDNCDICSLGKYGKNCDQSCPDNCLHKNCDNTGICNQCINNYKGDKCDECSMGKFGSNCTFDCPSGCANNNCTIKGKCNKGCTEGFYGNSCNINCSQTCMNSICDREHGACSQGCKTGYNGTMCTEFLEFIKDNDAGNLDGTIGASAGGILFILIVVGAVVVILLIKRRRRRGNKQENKDDNGIKSENETMTYSEINDIDVTAERNDPVRTNTASTVHSNINDELMAANDQEIDALYAKSIKPKNKDQEIKSATVNNPNYETPEYQTVNKAKGNKPAIASKPTQIDGNNIARNSSAIIEHVSGINDGNDAALEIEEDIESLSSKTKSVNLMENAYKAANIDYADTYYNVVALKKRKIKIDQLSDFVTKKTKQDFADEFQTLPAMLIKPYVDSQKRSNLSKNRYIGIYPYDDTRVVLKDGDSDYINASYIDGYNKNKAYIASIGPTTKYMGDMSAFWIMVWQENVGKIVMLTKLSEVGVPKCDKYWPDNDSSVTYANILVTCKSEEEYSDYTFRSFIIQKGPISRTIVQVYFTAWPDKGTPDDVTSLIDFREKVNNSKSDLNGPIIVHCSAGIGRTGTYIALDSVTKEGEVEGEADIFAFVRNMREQRVNIIQTAEQYQYLHTAIVHTLTFDSKAIQASKFGEYMKSHSKDHLERMFEKLQASVEQRSDEEKEAVRRNKALKNKNRDSADIPGDRNRPRLYMYMSGKPGSSDYINALYVNSFKIVNRYLIAQTPLPETVEDFLTLIMQEKVSCIINIDASSSVGKNFGILCPADNQNLREGAFTVNTERGNGSDNYLLCKMKISHKSKFSSEEVTIPYIQFIRWGNDKLTPEDPLQFVEFVREMELKFYGDDHKKPILVHCSTGAVRSGVFCVVSTLLEKTQIDQEVSVVNTVRQIKYRRHMAIPNKEQYIFCHQCVNEFVSTFDTFSNFLTSEI